MRRDKWTDTPLPWDEPAGKNPPDGAILDYWLAPGVAGPVRLRILDEASDIVRMFSSNDPVQGPDTTANLPLGWARPGQKLSAEPGPHRFIWDLRYAPPPATQHGYPISAVWGDTPLEPRGVWVMPGTYRLQLTVAGRTYERQLVVRMDPRVKTPVEELAQQFAAGMRIVESWRRDSAAIAGVQAMRAEVDSLKKAAGPGLRADSLTAFDAKLADLLSGGGAGGRRGGGPAPAGPTGVQGFGNPPGGFGGRPRGMGGGRERGEAGPPEVPREQARQGPAGPPVADNLLRLSGELGSVYGIVEGNDSAPTEAVAMAYFSYERSLAELLGRWDALRREGAGLGVAGR